LREAGVGLRVDAGRLNDPSVARRDAGLRERALPGHLKGIIEISKGSSNKYELDKSSGMLNLDRVRAEDGATFSFLEWGQTTEGGGPELMDLAFAVAASGCVADCTDDGVLDIFDVTCFQSQFDDGDPAADINGDGELNVLEFAAFQGAFVKGCEQPGGPGGRAGVPRPRDVPRRRVSRWLVA